MIASHRKDTRNRTRLQCARSIHREHRDALSFMILIPQRGMLAVPVHVNAQVAVIGDLTDGIACFVDPTREHAARRTVTDLLYEISRAIARPSMRRTENALRRDLLVARRRNQ